MDRNTKGQTQNSAGRMRRKSLSGRLGLQKAGEPENKRAVPPVPNRAPNPVRGKTSPPAQPNRRQPAAQVPKNPPPGQTRRAGSGAQQPRPQRSGTTQLNPQKAGYQPGGPRQSRRITQAEQIRLRNRRRIVGVGIVLGAMLFGIVLSINLLFKITAFRIENFDRSTPAATGIYSEEQILAALGLQVGDKLFFSTTSKTRQLQNELPYLDQVQVAIQMPGTVVVKVHPATERFAVMYSGGWMVLSDTLKILRIELDQPSNLVLLTGSLPAGMVPAVGQTLSLQSYNSLLGAQPELATSETARATADETLYALLTAMQTENLLAGVTALDVGDLSNLNFTYDGRVKVLLGGASNLEYKLRMGAAVLLDPEKGLAASDHGTLDISQQQSDGEIRAYFQPDEPEPSPSPEPEENAEESDENAQDGSQLET